MLKKIFVFLTGILFIGVNVYAAGDLIVNGNLGIGTSTPSIKLDLRSDTDGLNVFINQTSAPAVQAANYAVQIDGPTDLSVTTAFKSIVMHTGTSNVPATRGGNLQFQFRSPTQGNSTFSFIYGLDLAIRDISENARNYTGDTIAAFRTGGAYDGTGTINVTDLIGALIVNPVNSGPLHATNAYGMKIGQQTAGTNNYGIVLNGYGGGSDVVFGTRMKAKIYSKEVSGKEEVFVKDENGNETQISPHDPETGEWRYYSKNIKTGKVVEVNMEKLVKAVEKLTGEKFMIETIEEIE